MGRSLMGADRRVRVSGQDGCEPLVGQHLRFPDVESYP